jgi:uncharacterized protein involved in response to NO
MESAVVEVGDAVVSGFLQEAVDEVTGRSRHKWAVILGVLVLGGVIAVVVTRSLRRRAAARVGENESDRA